MGLRDGRESAQPDIDAAYQRGVEAERARLLNVWDRWRDGLSADAFTHDDVLRFLQMVEATHPMRVPTGTTEA
jgi:hypothetical protein